MPKTNWEESVAIQGAMGMMPGYMTECLIPFITSLLRQRTEEIVNELSDVAERTKIVFHREYFAGMKEEILLDSIDKVFSDLITKLKQDYLTK